MTRFRYHGMTVESALPLDLREQRADLANGVPDVVVRDEPTLCPPLDGLVWTSPVTGYRLHSGGDGRCWLVRGDGCFQLGATEILVSPVPLDDGRAEYLLTSVFSLWLQLTGRPALHAAAVGLRGGAIALMARSGGGKSTLASALVARGARLLCDDHVPVDFRGSLLPVGSGQPFLRLWPDSARRCAADPDVLPRVSPTSEKRCVTLENESEGAPDRLPLRTIYLVERAADGGGPIRVEPLPPGEALMALLAHGQMAGPAEKLGLGPSRLAALSRVVREIPVRRVRYPSAFELLPSVCEAVESDALA